MKIPFMDLNEDIPYLDRTVIDKGVMTPEHLEFRANGYYTIKNAISPIIIDAFKENKELYLDIALHQTILTWTKDMIGDEMLPRYQSYNVTDPMLYNWWCCNVFVALAPNQNLEILAKSHKDKVGVEGDDNTVQALKWDCQKGDVIVLHVATSFRGEKNLLPLYYAGSHYNEKFDLRRVIRNQWKTIQ